MEEIEILARCRMLRGANQHFLASAACRNQSDSRFDESDIRLGGSVDSGRMEANLATASKRHPPGRGHNRATRVLDCHRRGLELANRKVQLIPFLLLRAHE